MKSKLLNKFALVHPLLALPVMMILMGLSAAGLGSSSHSEYILGLFFWIVTAYLYMLWPLFSLGYISITIYNNTVIYQQYIKFRIYIVVAISIIILLANLLNIVSPSLAHNPIMDIIITIPFSAGFIFVLFTSSWMAAKLLLQAERGREVAAGEVLATSLLFIYWLLGLFFLHGRLKRLQSGASRVTN